MKTAFPPTTMNWHSCIFSVFCTNVNIPDSFYNEPYWNRNCFFYATHAEVKLTIAGYVVTKLYECFLLSCYILANYLSYVIFFS